MKIKVNFLDEKTRKVKVCSPKKDADFISWVQRGAR